MSKVILKDKKDLNTLRLNGWKKEGYEIVGSQDEIKRDINVEILSVKFSKIGQKTFDAYPNLKWIICRSHGYDNINYELAVKYNVGIVCTNPNTSDVANWISEKVTGQKVLVLGAGRIGRKFSEIYDGDCKLITSKTQYDFNIVKDYDTIVVTSSPTSEPILNNKLLEKFNGHVISVSRPCCIDNKSLLDAINNGRVVRADMDMLDSKLRKELLDTGKCKYYKHTAWGNDKTAYNDEYFESIFNEIDLCFESKSKNIALNRFKTPFEV